MYKSRRPMTVIYVELQRNCLRGVVVNPVDCYLDAEQKFIKIHGANIIGHIFGADFTNLRFAFDFRKVNM